MKTRTLEELECFNCRLEDWQRTNRHTQSWSHHSDVITYNPNWIKESIVRSIREKKFKEEMAERWIQRASRARQSGKQFEMDEIAAIAEAEGSDFMRVHHAPRGEAKENLALNGVISVDADIHTVREWAKDYPGEIEII